jgi:hypothetical protein
VVDAEAITARRVYMEIYVKHKEEEGRRGSRAAAHLLRSDKMALDKELSYGSGGVG